jgi:hypothetical protein
MRPLPSTQTFVLLAGYVLGGFALFWGVPEQVPPSWTVSARRNSLARYPGCGNYRPTVAVGPAMIRLVGPAGLVAACLLVRFSTRDVDA